jgi:hypothetical protein
MCRWLNFYLAPNKKLFLLQSNEFGSLELVWTHMFIFLRFNQCQSFLVLLIGLLGISFLNFNGRIKTLCCGFFPLRFISYNSIINLLVFLCVCQLLLKELKCQFHVFCVFIDELKLT